MNKLLISLIILWIGSLSLHAIKADGYSYCSVKDFSKPIKYIAIKDAYIYSDAHKESRIKKINKNTIVNVFSIGNNCYNNEKTIYMNTKEYGFTGVEMNDFKNLTSNEKININEIINKNNGLTNEKDIDLSNYIKVNNYTLDEGMHNGMLFTGYIDVNGLPQKEGVLYCPNKKDVNFEGIFKDGIFSEGKFYSCFDKKIKKYSYKIISEGKFNKKGEFESGTKMTILLKNNPVVKKIVGEYRIVEKKIHVVVRTYRRENKKVIFGKKYFMNTGVMKATEYTEGEVVFDDFDKSYFGVHNQVWKDGLKFIGKRLSSNKYDGTFIWPDGTKYTLNGEWISPEKRVRLKKRLDLINKQKQVNKNSRNNDKYFEKKEELQKIEKVKTEIKTVKKEKEFYNSLEKEDNKPINLETIESNTSITNKIPEVKKIVKKESSGDFFESLDKQPNKKTIVME